MILSAFLYVCFVFLAARRLARFLRLNFLAWSHPFLSYSFECALGLAILSFILFAAAVLQLLSSVFLWSLSAVLLPLALLEVKDFSKCRFKFEKEDWFWTASLLIYLTLIILAAGLPVSDRDEMIYQLEVPRQMLQAHGFVLLPDNFYAYFPQLGSLLTLWGLGTFGESSARLFHAFFGLLTAASLYGFGRKVLSKTAGVLAVILFLTVPAVMKLMTVSYVDLTYSCYAFMALAALLDDSEKSTWKRFLAAGLLCGCAAAVKYPGIQLMGVLGVFCMIRYLKDRDRDLLKGIPLLGIGLLILSPYLLRNWMASGWPLFPFSLLDLPLNPAFNWDKERAELFMGWLGQFGLDPGGNPVLQTLFAPFEVFVRGRFNEPRFYEGILGPVFLLLPLLMRRNKDKTVAGLCVFSILFLYYWALTTKQVRFLIPVVPVLSLMLAYGLQNTAWLWKSIAGVLLLGNAMLGFVEITASNPLLFLLGRETRTQYLQRQIPQYGIYKEVNRTLKTGEKVYLIHMKNYGYYLNVPWTADFVFERYRIDRVLDNNSEVPALAAFFKELKITHLLVDEAHLQSPVWGLEPPKQALFGQFLQAHASLKSRDRQYAFYEISV